MWTGSDFCPDPTGSLFQALLSCSSRSACFSFHLACINQVFSLLPWLITLVYICKFLTFTLNIKSSPSHCLLEYSLHHARHWFSVLTTNRLFLHLSARLSFSPHTLYLCVCDQEHNLWSLPQHVLYWVSLMGRIIKFTCFGCKQSVTDSGVN